VLEVAATEGAVAGAGGGAGARAYVLECDEARDHPGRRRERPGRFSAPAMLDAALLTVAAQAGASVRQPMVMRGVVYGDNGVSIGLADGGVVEADVVIHADGSGRHDGSGPIPNRERGVVGCKCHPAAAVSRLRGSAHAGRRRGRTSDWSPWRMSYPRGALTVRSEVLARHSGNHDSMLTALWPGLSRAAWARGGLANWERGARAAIAAWGYIAPGHPALFPDWQCRRGGGADRRRGDRPGVVVGRAGRAGAWRRRERQSAAAGHEGLVTVQARLAREYPRPPALASPRVPAHGGGAHAAAAGAGRLWPVLRLPGRCARAVVGR